MMPRVLGPLAVTMLLLGGGAGAAENPIPMPTPAALRIPRVSRPPQIQDFLEGRPREAESRVTGFTQYRPNDGRPVSQDTEAFLSYDDQNLYVVFVCKDDPRKVRAHRTKREDFFTTQVGGTTIGDDFVSVNIDTFLDRRRAYVLISNPLGVQRDGIYAVGRGTDVSFDAVWHSEGRLTADGFIVRFAIPFKSLRFHNAPVQQWGIALGRIIARNDEVTFWPYITQRIEGLVQQCATLDGIESIPLGRNIQLVPYSALSHERVAGPRGGSLARAINDSSARFGADGKIVVKESTTLDFTARPDFSQVESDDLQVTVNRRFEVFFPEKRPFFLENATFFQTDDVQGGLRLVDPSRGNLFFSRRIGDPEIGGRVTGRSNGWTYGALIADDRRPDRAIAAPEDSGRGAAAVARLQRELRGQSNVGVLATMQDYRESYNRVFSIDSRIKLDANWVVNGQAAVSDDRSLDEVKTTGSSYLLELFRAGKSLNYTGRYIDRSRDFRAELGFVPRVDLRQTDHNVFYRYRHPKRDLGFNTSATGVLLWGRDGELLEWRAIAQPQLALPRQTWIQLTRVEERETYQGIRFRKNRTGLFFATQWWRWGTVSGTYDVGKSINYFPAAGVPPFLGDEREAQATFTLRPLAQLRLEAAYIDTRLATRESSAFAAAGESVFASRSFRLKANYQFTRELSVRGIVERRSVTPNERLVPLGHERRVLPDVLVTYLLNPGTALHVGYSDHFEETERGRPSLSTARLFFAKISYLFRF